MDVSPESARLFAEDVQLQPDHYVEAIWSLLPIDESAPTERTSELFEAYLLWMASSVRVHCGGDAQPLREASFHPKFGWRVCSSSGYTAHLGKLAVAGMPRIDIGRGAYFAGPSTILGSGEVWIGAWTCIGPRSIISSSPIDHATNLLSYFNFRANRRADYLGLLQDEVSELREDRRGVHIGNDVWIGRETYIREGVSIGNGSATGLRSVVTRDLGKFAIFAGNPVTLIRKRFPDSVVNNIESLAWWFWDDDTMRAKAHLFHLPLSSWTVRDWTTA